MDSNAIEYSKQFFIQANREIKNTRDVYFPSITTQSSVLPYGAPCPYSQRSFPDPHDNSNRNSCLIQSNVWNFKKKTSYLNFLVKVHHIHIILLERNQEIVVRTIQTIFWLLFGSLLNSFTIIKNHSYLQGLHQFLIEFIQEGGVMDHSCVAKSYKESTLFHKEKYTEHYQHISYHQ